LSSGAGRAAVLALATINYLRFSPGLQLWLLIMWSAGF
jgi:hypothetical protein